MENTHSKFIHYAQAIKFKKQVKHVLGNNELFLQVTDEKTAPSVILDGQEYKLLQFHFHSPSEHLLENEQYALEVHFLHQSANSELSVVSLLFTLDKHNEAMQLVIDLVRNDREDDETLIAPANLLLPEKLSAFRYNGSLTAPPYSENVKWVVFRTTSTISPAQLEAMRELNLLNTSRDEEDIKNRTLSAATHGSK